MTVWKEVATSWASARTSETNFDGLTEVDWNGWKSLARADVADRLWSVTGFSQLRLFQWMIFAATTEAR